MQYHHNSNINKYFLKSVLDTASDAIVIIDAEGIIIMHNKSAADLFGYNPDELTGQNVKILTPEPHRTLHDNYIKNHIETGINKVIGIGREVTGCRKNGKTFPVRLALSKFIWEDQYFFTGVIHDLSREKETEQKLVFINKNLENLVDSRTSQLMESINQLSESNRNLENEINERILIEEKLKKREVELITSIEKERSLNLLKSRFVSIASHEFRTPLANILSSINLIEHYQENSNPLKSQQHLSKIKNNIQYLNGVLNDFLSMTQIEQGKISSNFTTVELSHLIQDITEDLIQIKKPNQTISYTNLSNQEIFCNTDANFIKHIMSNLINNAIKYSGDSSQISITLDKENKNFIINISDNGLGIPEEEQKFLFNIFFRASNVLNIQGTGLGLNIVKKYLDLLNGTIQIKSSENKGTQIKLTIPNNEKSI
ncbi:MAG: PAS domain-containing sensor histidine kinase [Saprospiraceae bacterium]|nr:PAS domain-containing sensor histidine kinase [Saprospiraceae bacterium]